MQLLTFLYPLLLFTLPSSALRSSKIKLSTVQSLTLRNGAQTSHRRVPAVPQLKCIGGSGCKHYQIDTMRCKNSGSDYEAEDIQWTCTASLPPEFKLGSTDVICEGYDGPDDPFVLKGSCGVEYRLLLTEEGEKKFGGKDRWWGGDDEEKSAGDRATSVLFWIIFIGVACWIAWSAVSGWANGDRGAGGRPGWGGGGGGGWGGGDDNDDPPPPYDWRPSPKPSSSYSAQQPQGWRPGFWSGALGGAAAGYMAGRGGNRTQEPRPNRGFFGGGRSDSGSGSGWFDNGEGSSRSGSGSSVSSARYESTGFGSTSRR